MVHWVIAFFWTIAVTGIGLSIVAAVLTIVPRLGTSGRELSDFFSRAPMLDVWVAIFTWVPWLVGWIGAGIVGFVGALVGQALVMLVWCFLHELAYRKPAQGPRIVKFLNRTFGRWQNHLALWMTLIALPGFWFMRFLQIAAYWPLVKLLNFPRYNQAEWINVSRHKFDGLIGYDLIWCLYCDWMTGVFSLSAEVLRNIESFWCPIRYYDGKKCENCRTDFPDLDHGWVPADGTMADVEKVMQTYYGAGRSEWFGHPARLTVKGKPVDPAPSSPSASNSTIDPSAPSSPWPRPANTPKNDQFHD